MSKTYTPNHKEIKRDWHLIDANGKVLGRIASDIATILTGKNKATYTPNINVGDHVVVINAEKVAVTGKKMEDKKYYRYTGFPGGIKEINLEKLMGKKPTEALKKAVYGMIPKNKLRKERLRNLHIYAGETHPHEGQLKK